MTIDEIKKDIQRKLRNATTKTYEDGRQIIDESYNAFYSQGNPRRKRTGTLRGATYAPSPEISTYTSHMELGYEGDQISYRDGTFSGSEVLGATMTGTYGVVGDSSYDEDAFEKIEHAIENNFSSEFS